MHASFLINSINVKAPNKQINNLDLLCRWHRYGNCSCENPRTAIFSAKALLAAHLVNLCELYTVLRLFYVACFSGWKLKEVRLNLSGSINRGTCPSTEEDLFQDLHITEKKLQSWDKYKPDNNSLQTWLHS